MDSNYKRVNKNMKIDELSAQVQHLQATLNQQPFLGGSFHGVPAGNVFDPIPDGSQIDLGAAGQQAQATRPSFSLSSLDTMDQASPSKRLADTQDPWPRQSVDLTPPLVNSNRLCAQGSRVMGDVSLANEQIDRLFSDYFQHYHRYLEILDPTCSPDQCYEQSPLLFWTIIGVAARRFDEEPTLLASLGDTVTRLAWTEISSLPHTISTIKALLLQCIWPYPRFSEATDMTSVFISIAIQAARKLGLHQPKDRQDFLRFKTRPGQEEVHDMIKTWSACNIIAHCHAASAGQESLFTQSWTIDRACEIGNDLTLPDGLRNRLMIVRFGDRVATLMSGNRLDPGGIPFEHERSQILRQLGMELDELQGSLFQKLDSINQIHFCALRLQLESYYFFDFGDEIFRQQGLLKAYDAAVTFISRILDEDKATDLLLYCPYELLRVLWQAMQVLSDILRSMYSQNVDSEAGQRLFHAGIAAARRASVENNDMPGRLSVIMSQLWRKRNAKNATTPNKPQLRIKSRLGASGVYDWLWYWRETFAGQTNAYPPSPTSLISPGPEVALGNNASFEYLQVRPNDRQSETSGNLDWSADLGANLELFGNWEIPLTPF